MWCSSADPIFDAVTLGISTFVARTSRSAGSSTSSSLKQSSAQASSTTSWTFFHSQSLLKLESDMVFAVRGGGVQR